MRSEALSGQSRICSRDGRFVWGGCKYGGGLEEELCAVAKDSCTSLSVEVEVRRGRAAVAPRKEGASAG